MATTRCNKCGRIMTGKRDGECKQCGKKAKNEVSKESASK
jgi:uncharacterized OB-fold protein